MDNKAFIFNIQRYSLHDGPGIRTLVFFKGCPLTCIWCSNPEGIQFKNEVRYIKQKCNGCGLCQIHCPMAAVTKTPEAGFLIARDKCIACGACVKKCYRKAKVWAGYEISLEDLMVKIRKDKAYYKSSGGGITVGGGDPLSQADFVEKLLFRCRAEGISTAIETEAFSSFETYKRCAGLCDTIFTDFKAYDDVKHIALTGISNKQVMDNIQRMGDWLKNTKSQSDFIIRIPLLPNINYTLDDMKQAAGFFKSVKRIAYIEILPFHNLGENKYEQLGLEYPLLGKDNLKAADVQDYADVLTDAGLTVKVTDW